MEFRVGLDLESNIRRGIDQERAVRRVGKESLLLQAGPNQFGKSTGKIAQTAGTVPLGKTAAGSCPQQFKVHQWLNFCGGVAVDFASELNFFKIRAGPDFRLHAKSPLGRT
jgi:hypothetical protein